MSEGDRTCVDPVPSGDREAHSPGGRVKGTVVITIERCKGCGFCVEFCPTDALSMGTAMNTKGYHYPDLSAPGSCNGCDICGMICPDFAIYGFFRKKPRPG